MLVGKKTIDARRLEASVTCGKGARGPRVWNWEIRIRARCRVYLRDSGDGQVNHAVARVVFLR